MTLAIHYVDYRGSQTLILRTTEHPLVVTVKSRWEWPLREERLYNLREMVTRLTGGRPGLLVVGRLED